MKVIAKTKALYEIWNSKSGFRPQDNYNMGYMGVMKQAEWDISTNLEDLPLDKCIEELDTQIAPLTSTYEFGKGYDSGKMDALLELREIFKECSVNVT